jgi:hypothetical protein
VFADRGRITGKPEVDKQSDSPVTSDSPTAQGQSRGITVEMFIEALETLKHPPTAIADHGVSSHGHFRTMADLTAHFS